jgi:carbon-monoxide dehydrogenase medium subunit
MTPNKFEYFAPTSLQEALSLLSTYQDEAKLLAGGQSLLSLMKLRLSNPQYLIDLGRLVDLNYIRDEGDKIAIGALTTYAQIKGSELLHSKCALLPQTASVVGDVQVRNRGTLGGSLAHADPAGDMPGAVIALEADMKVVSAEGERWIPVEDFFLAMLTTSLAPDEILTEIRVPVLRDLKTVYLKAAPRPSDFAVVGVALCLKLGPDTTCEEIAIGMTGIADKAYRAAGVEQQLMGRKLASQLVEQAASAVTQGVDVTEDIRGSAEYRSHLARAYVARAIEALLGKP